MKGGREEGRGRSGRRRRCCGTRRAQLVVDGEGALLVVGRRRVVGPAAQGTRVVRVEQGSQSTNTRRAKSENRNPGNHELFTRRASTARVFIALVMQS